jgi:hypothetical protein
MVDPTQHFRQGHRSGYGIEFIAIGTREITTAYRDDLGQNRVMPGVHGTSEHPDFAHPPAYGTPLQPQGMFQAFPGQHGSNDHISAYEERDGIQRAEVPFMTDRFTK